MARNYQARIKHLVSTLRACARSEDRLLLRDAADRLESLEAIATAATTARDNLATWDATRSERHAAHAKLVLDEAIDGKEAE